MYGSTRNVCRYLIRKSEEKKLTGEIFVKAE
jgi:hypothetical protein